ncbi:DAK2 domain-containing protein [soil metagenome]
MTRPGARPAAGPTGTIASVPVLERLDADGLRRTIFTYRDALVAHRERINRLNVYPVPDGDTGTNMALTLDSVCADLDAAGSGMAPTCAAISHGSLMGARGNSGVILSQVLRGLTDVLREHDSADGGVLAAALATAAKAAYGAVMRPVEGTILTVVREAAEAAEDRAANGGPLAEVAEASRHAGADALERTPELLAVLRDAGVVDAGGSGFVLLLDAFLHAIDGRPTPEPLPAAPVRVDRGTAGSADQAPGVAAVRYEVVYLLEAPDGAIPAFKEAWAGLGDSIVVVGGDGLWNCHIHTDDIGGAIEVALDRGRPSRIRVTDLVDQVEQVRCGREAAADSEGDPAHVDEPVTTAVVAVATGEGNRRLFHSLGVQRIVAGGQSMNPSTAELLEATELAPADEVVILPNNANIVPVAEQVDAHTAKTVRVLATTGITEGLAALIAYDQSAGVDDNVRSMGEAAEAVVTGEVTRAVRDAPSEAGPIHQGDYLGLSRRGISFVDPTLAGACIGLLDHLVGDDHELVTIIEGEGSTAAETLRLTEWLTEHRPTVAAEVHHGGQPAYP